MPVYDDQKQKSKSLTPAQLAGLDQLDAEMNQHMSSIAGQEEAAAAPSATHQKESTPEELGKAEGAGNPKTEAASDTLGKGYTGDDADGSGGGKKRGIMMRIGKRRAIGIGGGATGIVLTGAVFGLLTVSSGPLEIIHIAKLMEQLHFSSQQNADDSAFQKILRYAKYKDTPQNTRLGYFANKFADRYENNLLEKSGITTNYTEKLGYLDSYSVDVLEYAMAHPESVTDPKLKAAIQKANVEVTGSLADKGSALNKSLLADNDERFRAALDADVYAVVVDDYHGGSQDAIANLNKEVSAHLDSTYGIKPVADEGIAGKYTLSYSMDNKSYFAQKSLMKAMIKEGGYKGVMAAIGKQLGMERAEITLHPLKRYTQKTLKAIEAAYLKDRNNAIENGSTPEVVAANEADPKDTTTTDNATSAQGAANEVAADGAATSTTIAETGDAAPAVASLQSTIGKTAIKGVGAVAMLCLLDAIANMSAADEQKIKDLPLERFAMHYVSLGMQIMAGSPDVDLNLVGVDDSYLHKGGFNWSDSPTIEKLLNQPATGPKMSASAGDSNVLTDILSQIPGLNSICGAVNSAPGAILQIGLSFIGGPVSAVANLAVSAVISQVAVPVAARVLAGQAVSSTPDSGAEAGSYIDAGSNIAASDSSAAEGGVVLSTKQESELTNYNNQQAQQDFQDHDLAYRLFSPTDSRSLVGTLIDKQSGSVSRNLSDVAGIFLNMGHTLATLPQKLFSGIASADTQPVVTYPQKTVGMSLDFINNPLLQNPEENDAIVMNSILPTTEGQNFIDKGTKCFGRTVGLDGSITNSATPPNQDDLTKNDCDDQSDDWIRFRGYIWYNTVANSGSCYLGDSQACADAGYQD